jgi:hypothetical protein
MQSWTDGTTRDARYYNNAACVALQMGLTDAALLFFRKGFQVVEAHREEGNRRGVHCMISYGNCSAALIYNCGVALLKSNQPLSAFKCFERVTRQFKRFPGLWIRLAECCVHHDLSARCKEETKQKSPVHSTLSHGELRRLLVRFETIAVFIVGSNCFLKTLGNATIPVLEGIRTHCPHPPRSSTSAP